MTFCFRKLEYYGVYDESLPWFKNYFTERKQFVHPPGGDPAYERGGDARRKFCIKPLKETDLGVAQAFFDP